MQDFKFTMRTNKASPKLFQACASGDHLQSAVLSVRRPGKDTADFLQISLSDVLVSSFVSMGSSGGTDPMEEIMLNFSKIKVSYKPMKADGSLEGSVEAGWDVPANRKF
jgi:type VI secretion system secreted protein Hcp